MWGNGVSKKKKEWVPHVDTRHHDFFLLFFSSLAILTASPSLTNDEKEALFLRFYFFLRSPNCLVFLFIFLPHQRVVFLRRQRRRRYAYASQPQRLTWRRAPTEDAVSFVELWHRGGVAVIARRSHFKWRERAWEGRKSWTGEKLGDNELPFFWLNAMSSNASSMAMRQCCHLSPTLYMKENEMLLRCSSLSPVSVWKRRARSEVKRDEKKRVYGEGGSVSWTTARERAMNNNARENEEKAESIKTALLFSLLFDVTRRFF